MPWCDTCDSYRSPSVVTVDGSCPECGRAVDPGALKRERKEARKYDELDQSAGNAAEIPPIPWHFWVLVVGVVLYLGWRLLQGVGWLVS